MIKSTKSKVFLDKISNLFWDINKQKLPNLSDEAIIERVLMYGDLNDYKNLWEVFGKEYGRKVFRKLISKKRVNLAPATVNYVKLILNVS